MEKSEILHIWHVCDVENVAIYAKFMQFFATIYALSCGEKLSPKVNLWGKNDIYQVCRSPFLFPVDHLPALVSLYTAPQQEDGSCSSPALLSQGGD